MLKLEKITFIKICAIPGIRAGDLSELRCDNPAEVWRGWRVALRGASVILISPRGWMPGRRPAEWDPADPAVIHEVPRSNCIMHWTGLDQDVEDIVKGKFISPPLGAPLEKVEPRSLLAQLPPQPEGDA